MMSCEIKTESSRLEYHCGQFVCVSEFEQEDADCRYGLWATLPVADEVQMDGVPLREGVYSEKPTAYLGDSKESAEGLPPMCRHMQMPSKRSPLPAPL